MSKLSNKNIGITGTIGSGKSSVVKLISESYNTVSADQIVSDLYDDPAFAKVINEMMFDTKSDVVDKAKLSTLIFSDSTAKKRLEAFIHPIVKSEIRRLLEESKSLIFVEVPLMYEAGFQDLFDKIIVVIADEDIIINRLIKNRGFSKDAAQSIIDTQYSTESKVSKADYVIDNSTSEVDLKLKTLEIINQIERSN